MLTAINLTLAQPRDGGMRDGDGGSCAKNNPKAMPKFQRATPAQTLSIPEKILTRWWHHPTSTGWGLRPAYNRSRDSGASCRMFVTCLYPLFGCMWRRVTMVVATWRRNLSTQSDSSLLPPAVFICFRVSRYPAAPIRQIWLPGWVTSTTRLSSWADTQQKWKLAMSSRHCPPLLVGEWNHSGRDGAAGTETWKLRHKWLAIHSENLHLSIVNMKSRHHTCIM